MIDKEILFIFGTPCSGTTYVNALVREYADFGLAAEADFVMDFHQRIGRYGDLTERANFERLIQDICSDRFLAHFRTYYSEFLGYTVDVTPEDIWRDLPEQSFAGAVYAVFSAVAEQMKCSRIGNKNPAYVWCLKQLLEWFPSAKFLHVVRDGRDVALSLMKQIWGEKSAYTCANKWVGCLEQVKSFRETVDENQLFELHYEKLLREPSDTIDQLEAFLQICLEPATKQKFTESINGSHMRNNFGKWRDQMSHRQLRVFEAVAGDWLSEYGYELRRNGCARFLG